MRAGETWLPGTLAGRSVRCNRMLRGAGRRFRKDPAGV
ncbi:Hypothetical Protein RSKD131_3230 [Cereibacter sphaeroides KD131]|nr:Hypothetical Protein RSKD131_3230 [Cereibacter sphaeroides KD131]